MRCPIHSPHFLQYFLSSIIVLPYFVDPTCIHNNTDDVRIHNTEVHLCNHCSSGKAISITYFEHVFVALGIQQAMHMCHIVICGLHGSTVFSHYLLSETFLILRKTEQDMIKKCILVFMLSTCYSYPILMKLEFS